MLRSSTTPCRWASIRSSPHPLRYHPEVSPYSCIKALYADQRRDIYYKDVQLFKKQEVVDKVSEYFDSTDIANE
jgi:hypothetical protein